MSQCNYAWIHEGWPGLVRVAVAGASGYTGGELLRLLLFHREAEVVYASSREYAGKPIHFAHPHLRGFYRSLRFSQLSIDSILKADPDAVFMALPHGVGTRLTAELVESGMLVVDLSADYRLKDPSVYKEWYGVEHPYPDLLEKAVYGLPEIRRDELKSAKLIASPGCNATATIIAVAPLASSGLLEGIVVVDVKAGSSEAGGKPARSSHHPEREGSIRPYSVQGGHRHQAEAEQELSRLAGKPIKVSMAAHAVSSVRGALASAHVVVGEGADASLERVWRLYASMYGKEPFVRLVHPVLSPRGIDVKYVIGSNFVDVTVGVDEKAGRITAYSALDNLVKGAAGQAIQAFNIAMGFKEEEGLYYPPLHPA